VNSSQDGDAPPDGLDSALHPDDSRKFWQGRFVVSYIHDLGFSSERGPSRLLKLGR